MNNRNSPAAPAMSIRAGTAISRVRPSASHCFTVGSASLAGSRAGKVFGERAKVCLGTRRPGTRDPLVELLEGEPAVGAMARQLVDELLTVMIGNAQPGRIGALGELLHGCARALRRPECWYS